MNNISELEELLKDAVRREINFVRRTIERERAQLEMYGETLDPEAEYQLMLNAIAFKRRHLDE